VAVALGLAFWGNARAAAHGFFPAPLDDVYIHFDFARSLATGHGLAWVPGNGYSSGETAPLYALVLACGHLIGFRGAALGLWSAAVAAVSIASLLLSVRQLVTPCRPWVAWTAPLLVLSSALVDWTLVSGMEVALHGAVLGRTLLALDRATSAASDGARREGRTREAWQRRIGIHAGALVLLRPESVVLVPLLATFAARAIGARSAPRVAVRVALVPGLLLSAMAGTNLLLTGDPRAAGAQLKLLSSNPYLGEADRARAFVENLVTFGVRAVSGELASVTALAWALPLLVLAALLSPARRPVAATCVLGALGWTLLVSWNGNAPFHNFRYYAPALLLVLVAAALGAAALGGARARGPLLHLAKAAVFAALASGATRLPVQLDHFRRCVANVRDQQVEVGLRLAALTPASARVLVGDAGAIPFVSGRGAIDALGLGGFRGLPFARAAVQGEAAVVELLERVAPAERPTHLALYPNWFGAITGHFGSEIARVSIEDNVICGGPTKIVYVADWSALAPGAGLSPALAARIVDELDVADVISEREHAYVPPSPEGGWTTLDVLEDDLGAKRFDGGRILPEGTRASFRVGAAPAGGRAALVVRTDPGSGEARVITARGAQPLALEAARIGAWRMGRATLADLATGDVVTIEAARGTFRHHHVWITADVADVKR
jgi:hypothetical protein